jgi:hypothetical protein
MYSKECASMSTWFWWLQWAKSGEAAYRSQDCDALLNVLNKQEVSSTVHALVDPEVQLMTSRDWREQYFNPANFIIMHRLTSRILYVTSWVSGSSVVIPWNGHRRHRTLLFWGRLKSVVHTDRPRNVQGLLNKIDLALEDHRGHAAAGARGCYIWCQQVTRSWWPTIRILLKLRQLDCKCYRPRLMGHSVYAMM